MRFVIQTLIILCLMCTLAAAGEAWLRWDPVDHPGLSDYRIEVDIGNDCSQTFEVDATYNVGLVDGYHVTELDCTPSCFRVVSIAGELESAPSMQIDGYPTIVDPESDGPFVSGTRNNCWIELPVMPPTNLQREDVSTAPGT